MNEPGDREHLLIPSLSGRLTFLLIFTQNLPRQRVMAQRLQNGVQQSGKTGIKIVTAQRQSVFLPDAPLPYNAAVAQNAKVMRHRRFTDCWQYGTARMFTAFGNHTHGSQPQRTGQCSEHLIQAYLVFARMVETFHGANGTQEIVHCRSILLVIWLDTRDGACYEKYRCQLAITVGQYELSLYHYFNNQLKSPGRRDDYGEEKNPKFPG